MLWLRRFSLLRTHDVTTPYYRGMVAWRDAIARIADGTPEPVVSARRRRSKWQASPILITGPSGAGKTRLWSALTGRPAADAMSVTVDDGYMLRPARRAAALATVPGQWSQDRYSLLSDFFDEERRLTGVIFIASNGYDRVWPHLADNVAATLKTVTLRNLRERNLRIELSNFNEVCDRITARWIQAPDNAPRWLLTIVNKIDLYLDKVGDAEKRYLPGANSAFADRAQRLVSDIGALRMTHIVVPAATTPSTYQFNSARGVISVPSQMSPQQCRVSLASVVETLGELNAS